jgi:hypothetical protein
MCADVRLGGKVMLNKDDLLTPWSYDGHGINGTDAEGYRPRLATFTKRDDDRANALRDGMGLLMAAAPEMYTALIHISRQSLGDDWTPEQAFQFCKQTARAALKLAHNE